MINQRSAVLTISFLRAPGGLVHICVGRRPYCGVVVDGVIVDLADHEQLCRECCAIVKRLVWLMNGESGGHNGH